MNPRLLKLVPWLVVAASTGGILLATLHPGGHSSSGDWSFKLTTGDAALGELLQNLILFIPLGIGLALCGVRPLRAVALGALLSFSVEFAQQWIPGRDPSVGDIVCNTISTPWRRTRPSRPAGSPSHPPARGLHALGAAVLAILVWLGTAAALQPTFDRPLSGRSKTNWDFGDSIKERFGSDMLNAMLYVRATFHRVRPAALHRLAAV
jgi:hypothetical protein